jgi:hypothetical protein
MSVSNATITVDADGPNKRTAAKTNVSETEIRALMEGSLILKDPVRNVRPTRYVHSIPVAFTAKSYAEAPIT